MADWVPAREAQMQGPAASGQGAGGGGGAAGGSWTPAREANRSDPSVTGFLGNVVTSGLDFAKNIVNIPLHPINTLEGVTNLLQGMYEKTGGAPIGGQPHGQYLDAVGDFYKQRYGSLDNIGHTLYTDPVGVAADAATLLSGTGAVAGGAEMGARAANLGRVANVAGKVADASKTAAQFVDPLALANRGGPALVRKVVNPEKLYLSALKPPPSWYTPAEANAIAATGLAEHIPVSEHGLQNLYDKILDINNQIRGKIAGGAGAGVEVQPDLVANRLDQTASKFRNQVNPNADLDAIKASRDEWLETQGAKPSTPTGLVDARGNPIMNPATPAQPIPADRAQAIKQGTYQQLKDRAYGELKGASIESQKALARGIKEELASQIPELAGLNARDSRLLALEDALERSVRRIGNHQLLGIGTPVMAAGVGAATKSNKLAAVAGIIKAVVDNPLVKSNLAIAIHAGSRFLPSGAVAPLTAGSRVQAYLDHLQQLQGQDNQEQQQQQPQQPQQQGR